MRVPVVLRVGSAELDLVVEAAPHAPAAAVLQALADGPVPADAHLLVDGRRVPPGATVADVGLRAGSVVEISSGGAGPDRPEPIVDLWVTGGLHAGQRVPLAPGAHVVGATASADVALVAPGISGRHARISVAAGASVTITDARSHLGTAVNGCAVATETPVTTEDRVQLGPVPVRLRPPRRPVDEDGRHRRVVDGRVVLRRGLRSSAVAGGVPAVAGPVSASPMSASPISASPMSARPASGGPVSAPSNQPADPPPPRVPWAAVAAPLAIGALLALVYSPTLALFCLLGPVIALSSWADERRRAATARRNRRRDEAAALAEYTAAVDQAAADEALARRARHPDPAEVVTRAIEGDRRLWERRPCHADFLELAVGTGSVDWQLPLAPPAGGDPVRSLVDVPISMRFTPGTMLGVAGPADDRAAVVRWLLCQIAVLHGPADVRIVLPAQGWDWCKWLPHTHSASSLDGAGPVVVVLADAADAGGTQRLKDHSAMVVLARHIEDLPAGCTAVLELRTADGAARFSAGEWATELRATGIVADAARAVARSLAAFEDGDASPAARLPERVAFDDVVHLHAATADELAERWRSAGAVPRPATPIGLTADGPFVLDLDVDGPHGLLGGTTGSGKSELLRTIVLGLAVALSPEHISFLLIDFKGGSAFSGLSELPHTVGVVTDLDDHLAARALRSLEAEIRRRERVLRTAGAEDLRAYLLGGHAVAEPLPRLVVVIDEFATLATDLPGFVESLVDVAQRGRALGLHLLLATQRPSGVVSPTVRANTGFRVALRMHDDHDSIDVIGTADAAHISRSTPGRAIACTEHGRAVTFQAAVVARPDRGTAPEEVIVQPFMRHAAPPADRTEQEPGACDSRLAEIVSLLQDAAVVAGCRAPRRPWLDPLPPYIALEQLREVGGAGVPLGLVDDPDRQCRHVFAWSASVGSLAFLGDPSGGTDALRALAVSVSTGPDPVHLYGLDFGSGRLADLQRLPGVGTIVGAADRERQERLIRHLAAEIERRRAATAVDRLPTVILLLDNYGAFHAAFDDVAGLPLREQFIRTLIDGPAFGVFAAVAADRPSAIPPSAAAAFAERLVFRLADPIDAHLVGLSPNAVSRLGPGRAVHVGSALELQIATAPIPPAGADAATTAPVPIDVLLPAVLAAALPAATSIGGVWTIPIGVADHDLQPAVLRLAGRDAMLVTGPARSGRSTWLVALASAVRAMAPETRVAAVALRPSPLQHVPDIACATQSSEVERVLDAIAAGTTPRLLLIDDAEVTDRHAARLTALLDDLPDGLRVVVAGRTDSLRHRYGHWTAPLRRTGAGVLLAPRSDADGELFGVTLPRRPAAFPPGRGYLVSDGTLELVQFAMTEIADALEGMKRVAMGQAG